MNLLVGSVYRLLGLCAAVEFAGKEACCLAMMDYKQQSNVDSNSMRNTSVSKNTAGQITLLQLLNLHIIERQGKILELSSKCTKSTSRSLPSVANGFLVSDD